MNDFIVKLISQRQNDFNDNPEIFFYLFFLFYKESFAVGLFNGPAPNIGRVKVKYDDTWSGVCYEFKEGDTRPWSFSNVQVVCRELGFPGAMFAKKGCEETDKQHSKIYGYKCTEGKNHPRT